MSPYYFCVFKDLCSASGSNTPSKLPLRRSEASSSNQPINPKHQLAESNLYAAHTTVISKHIDYKHALYEHYNNQEHVNDYYQQQIAGRNRNNIQQAPPIVHDHSHVLYDQQGENQYPVFDTSTVSGHNNLDQHPNPAQNLNPTQHLHPTQHNDPAQHLNSNYYSQSYPLNHQQHNVPYDPSSFQNQPYDQFLHPEQDPGHH